LLKQLSAIIFHYHHQVDPEIKHINKTNKRPRIKTSSSSSSWF